MKDNAPKKHLPYTPIFESIISLDGIKLADAATFGLVWRYSQMECKNCHASVETMADKIGVSDKTVRRSLLVLQSCGLVKNLTPDQRNNPHQYVLTAHAKALIDPELVGQNDQPRLDKMTSEESLLRESLIEDSSTNVEEKNELEPETRQQHYVINKINANRKAKNRREIKVFDSLEQKAAIDTEFDRLGQDQFKQCVDYWLVRGITAKGELVTKLQQWTPLVHSQAGKENGAKRERTQDITTDADRAALEAKYAHILDPKSHSPHTV